jgi:hypothetical protein
MPTFIEHFLDVALAAGIGLALAALALHELCK